MKRTFIAVKVYPGEKLLKAVDKMRSELKNESVKWVDLNQLHITLAFLGDTSEESIRDVSEMLVSTCQGSGEVEFEIKGVGVFKSISDPKVVWAGIGESRNLRELNQNISGGLKKLGLNTEDRDFKPHLTIARVRSVKNQKSLRSILSDYESVVFQKSRVSEIIYFESILQQTGPLYLPLKRISL